MVYEANGDTNNSQSTWNNSKQLEKPEICRSIETVQTTTLLRSAEIVRKILEN